MKRKRGYFVLGLALFLVGFLFIENSQDSVTGAFLGISPGISSVTGIFLWIIAGILFMVGEGGLEKKVKLVSTIKSDRSLQRLAEEATRNQDVQKEMDHLVKELSRGHCGAGIGDKHIEGTDVWYMRGAKGARLFYRKMEEGYEIVGKAAGTGTKYNENKVIKRLQEKYHY